MLSALRLVAANLIFQDTVERILVGEKFVDIPKGLFLIRGENVVMLGEVVSPERRGSASSHDLH